jgi:hypothetical protein
MTDLLKYREAMVQACAIAIDQMILAAENEPLLQPRIGVHFESDMLVRFQDTDFHVRSKPALNLMRDVQEQLTRRTYAFEVPPEPPAETIAVQAMPSASEIMRHASRSGAKKNGKKTRSIIPKKTPPGKHVKSAKARRHG